MSILRVPIIFRLLTYTMIILNPIFHFLMRMHEQIKLFAYHSFIRYSLKRLYYMFPYCFNPDKNCSCLIEYKLQDCEINTKKF